MGKKKSFKSNKFKGILTGHLRTIYGLFTGYRKACWREYYGMGVHDYEWFGQFAVYWRNNEYRNILKLNLKQSAEKWVILDCYHFQQDNDPKPTWRNISSFVNLLFWLVIQRSIYRMITFFSTVFVFVTNFVI